MAEIAAAVKEKTAEDKTTRDIRKAQRRMWEEQHGIKRKRRRGPRGVNAVSSASDETSDHTALDPEKSDPEIQEDHEEMVPRRWHFLVH